jgi:hypothetical protein
MRKNLFFTYSSNVQLANTSGVWWLRVLVQQIVLVPSLSFFWWIPQHLPASKHVQITGLAPSGHLLGNLEAHKRS